MTITSLRREEIADVGHPRYEERLASTGRAFSNVEVRVADADERALPPGEIGEIQVRGEVVMEDGEVTGRAGYGETVERAGG